MAQLIVALDVPNAERAEELVDKLYELDVILKIGFEALFGYPARVLSLLRSARRSHLRRRKTARYSANRRRRDGATRSSQRAHRQRARAGRTRHDACGGRRGQPSAQPSSRSRRRRYSRLRLLTSIAPEDLNELGFMGGPGENAIRLAALARDAGCSGVVCSAHEVRDLKRFFGDDFLTLTPGIRPTGSVHADQKRVDDAGAGGRGRRRLLGRWASDRRSRRSGQPPQKRFSKRCPFRDERRRRRRPGSARAAWGVAHGTLSIEFRTPQRPFRSEVSNSRRPGELEAVARAIAEHISIACADGRR